MKETLVKICGVTSFDDAMCAVEAGALALGFNFYARSSRYLAPESARRIIERLPAGVLSVGVFVNEGGPGRVEELAAEAGVGAVQLHGDETPEYCRGLKGFNVIKALRVGAGFAPERAAEFGSDAVLLDAFAAGAYGGTGHTFDWALARRTRELVPKLFLAGGLTPENVADAVRAVRPYAVDVCSGVESAPGRKDWRRVRRFVEAALSAEAGA